MSTTPAGLPAWSRTADASVYGGHSDKRDYQAQGVVNPQTDVSAAQFIRLAADVAALTRVAPFCVMTVQCNDTVPDAPTVVRAQQMTAVSLAGYEGDNPTGDFPELSRLGDGDIRVDWAETVEDDYGVSHTVSLVHAMASAQDASGYVIVTPIAGGDGHSFRFRVYDSSGNDVPDALITFEVS